MWHLSLTYQRNVVDVVHFCDNNWSSANFDVTTLEQFFVYRRRHPGTRCCYRCSSWTSWFMLYCTLYVATNDNQHGSMSVSDDQFLSFLRGHLLCLGLLLFSFYLLFLPFLLCSSFCRNLYKVGNNCVSPMHCCVFFGINWVAYSFLLLDSKLIRKVIKFL